MAKDLRAGVVFRSLCCKSPCFTPRLVVRNNLQGVSLSRGGAAAGKAPKGTDRMGGKALKVYFISPPVPAPGASWGCRQGSGALQGPLVPIGHSESKFLQPLSQGTELRAQPTQGHRGRTEKAGLRLRKEPPDDDSIWRDVGTSVPTPQVSPERAPVSLTYVQKRLLHLK